MRTQVLKFFKYLKWCFRGGYTEVNYSIVAYPEILKGKRALITGGSEGIGFAIAKKFLEAGAEVTITGRNMGKLQNAMDLLKDNERLHILQWDVCDVDKIDKKLQNVCNVMGGMDIFVNNAAYLTNDNPTLDVFRRTMTTNVEAAYFLCSKVCKIMQGGNGVTGGHVLNISSINSFQACSHPYFISKRALNAITEGFAKQYVPYNIIVNAIAPGYCNSSINKQDNLNSATL